MKRILCLSSMLCCMLLLLSCGFHPRNNKRMPAALHRLYYHSVNPYDPLNVELKQTLQSLGIILVKHPSAAAYGLYVTDNNLTHSQPDIGNSNQASSIAYTLTAQVKLANRYGKTVSGPLSFSASNSQTLGIDQIYTTSISSSVRQQLQQNIISSIYFWLSSDEIKRLTSTHRLKSDANKHKTTAKSVK